MIRTGLLILGLWEFSSVSGICFLDVGCFENTNGFLSFLFILPQSPSMIKPTFSLYTRSNLNSPQELYYKDYMSLINSYFDPSLKSRLLVHGYLDDPTRPNHWTTRMKNELLSLAPMNVIVVRWTIGAFRLNYIQAAANTRVVGKLIALLVQTLTLLKGGNNSDYHIIGHSLGSHVAAFAGNSLPGLGRISALDPAGPSFEKSPPDARIDPTDATFVDVIHSNGIPLILLGLGMFIPAGHVDFYVNGGKIQPGCELPTNLLKLLGTVLSQNFNHIEYIIACNHLRVVELFIESINSVRLRGCKFCAFNCESYGQFLKGTCTVLTQKSGELGFHADEYPLRNNAYIITKGFPPYCSPAIC